jgi:hypothetical protein
MTTQLLCTFVLRDDIGLMLPQIRNTYVVVYNYIYVLQNRSNINELFVTYNIDSKHQPHRPLANTILLHRKKESNTLYTINALNQLIADENNGIIDDSYIVDWPKYKNCIILTGPDGVRKISTKIFDIVKLDNEEI